ncbi:MAG: prepilin-type N-terminal cleavage/methylation domain-containing protein [Elusimicrobiaceae bacterium]|nr:prepilin-type N-terminal cleavage/methylation domain-containing protein [Elusimicrobiaceae bacterium]
MKKGFTLIELLVVIVIVGILVTVALPKYKTAMEKGRGLEAIANAAAVSDALNVYYVRNYNTYAKTNNSAEDAADYALRNAQTTTNRFFNPIVKNDISVSGTTAIVTVTRRDGIGAKSYKIVFKNENGEVTERYCICVSGNGCQRYCQAMGATTAHTGGGWNL